MKAATIASVARIKWSVLASLGLAMMAALPAKAELVLAEKGKALAPIVIYKDAPPLTRLAADELAQYIEKTSGAKMQVIEGEPQPMPEKAIWVGYQPALKELFPKVDFDFKHPEEILIVANEKHLVIAGRDRWDPDHLTVGAGRATIKGVQQEYGTHNAVYTFLHDTLGVRWLWPGDLGIDIAKHETLALAPFTYRYHPQVRARSGLLAYSTLHRAGPGGLDRPTSGYWLRAQRLQLCELPSTGGHGPWRAWRNRFLETHPEYFALQPDGTRGTFSDKMCFSNPDLARQWLDDVEEELRQNPTQRVFNASPPDGWYSGHCVCDNCRAWDHPEGELRHFVWRGLSQQYVALSDRDITFANRVARGLKERFPDRELYVCMLAYGHTRPAPIAAVPDDNVIILNVANFLFASDSVDRGSAAGRKHRDNFGDWGKLTKHNFWRPNVGAPVGFQWGMPDVPLRRTMDDLRFAAEHGMMGLYVDYVREHWATQGPLYYLMAQLVWNPYQDGEAVLKDYYRRAFGPAAREMDAYWTYLEKLREEYYGMAMDQERRDRAGVPEFYTPERLDSAGELIAAAQKALGPDDELYRKRIAFVEAGLDFTRLVTDCARLVRLVNQNKDPDGQARTKVQANWEELRALQKRQPGAVRWQLFFGGSRGDGPPTTPRYAPPLLAP